MKKLFLLTLFLSPIGLNSIEQQQNLSDLNWLLGKWQRTNTRAGTTAFEFWEKTSEHSFQGIGFSMKGTDTTFVEYLSVELKDGKLFYGANVSENPEPVYFELIELEAQSFISENKAHDFPKMISYELENDLLTAIISDGGEKKMGFTFIRIVE